MSPLPLLTVLTGAAGSGKSTVAAALASQYGARVIKFASPLKTMLRAIGLTDAHIEGALKEAPCDLLCGQTPRHAMQTLGTEWGRAMIGPDVWVEAWTHEVLAAMADGVPVIVDDCRFENELDAALSLGAYALRLERDGAGAGDHASEHGLSGIDMPCVDNNRPLDDVLADVFTVLSVERGWDETE